MKKIIYKGRVITLVTEGRVLPNGAGAKVEIVEHPGAVVIVPFLTDDKIILLHQYRPTIRQYLYEFPAGTLNKGEAVLRCAQRELIEETGYSGARFKKLGQIYPVPGYSTEVLTIFRANNLSPAYAAADPDEVIRVKIFTKLQLKKLFKSGKIKDAKTICGLTMSGIL